MMPADGVTLGVPGRPAWLDFHASPSVHPDDDVYSMIKPALTPYDHQRRAVNDAWKNLTLHGFHALFMEMGTGKTKTTIDTWMIAVHSGFSDCLVVVSPKTLMSTWTDEEIPKHLTLAGVEVLQWDNKKTETSRKLFSRFLNSPVPIIWSVNVEAFQSLNDELRLRMSDLLRKRKTLLVIDECFAAGTMVDTLMIDNDTGLSYIKGKPIELVSVGDIVISAAGPSPVIGTTMREVLDAVIIKTGAGSITCSFNHPFLTNYGWIRARDLRPGNLISTPEAAMRLVRGCVLTQVEPDDESWSNIEVLRKVLLCEMEDEPTGDTECCVYRGTNKEIHCGCQNFLRKSSRTGCCQAKADRGIEPHGPGGMQAEGVRDIASNEASPQNTGREREGLNSPAGCFLGGPWEKLGRGVANKNKSRTAIGIPDMLQGGYCKQGNDDCNRSRWIQPQSCAAEGSGRKERQASGFVRVESVEILEPGNSQLDSLRDASGKLYFYDLKVARHPSFSVNGLLVHNCSNIKGPDAKRAKALVQAGKLAKGRMILTGTETSKGPLDLYMQFEFLKPGFFGVKSFFMYRSKYAILEDCYGSGGRTFKKVVGYQKLNELMDSIAPYCTRALKRDCLDLPEKIRQRVLVDLNPEQKRMYDELKKHLASILASGEVMTVPNKISLFTKFRQITGGTVKNGDEYEVIDPLPQKLKALLDEVEDTDEQAIIWCAFRGEVGLIAKALSAYGRVSTYDGSTEIDDRSQAKVDFQNGTARFFVANMKAGAYGLNLQNCHLQYFYSRDLSPQANWQAEDRSHRPGQKQACVYKSLVCRGTVDERVLDLIEQSSDLRDILRGMSSEDMYQIV